MSKRLASTDVVGHPAAQAWARLRPRQAAPTGAVRLQRKGKGTVYRLEGAGPDGSDIIAKCSSPERISRERAVYEGVLPALPVPTVRYHGFADEPDGACCWLFLEDAGGEGYSPRSAEHRALAGQWLGLLHTSAVNLPAPERLPDRGPGHYLHHLRSGRETILRNLTNPALSAEDVSVLGAVVGECEAAAAHWAQVEGFSAGMRRTLIHGDFAPKNVRVRAGQGGNLLLPFDWGSAGWGVPAADLVQSGSTPDTCWDYWASPDLAAYGSIVRGSWPHLDVHDLQELATLGKLFRCLMCIDLDAQSLATEWVERPMRNMRIYKAHLADALRAAGWGC